MGVLTPQLREVVCNVAIRRATYEAPHDLAAAAVAFGRAGLTDPRVAAALLSAAVQPGSGASAAEVAALLRLCGVAKVYDHQAFAAAADLLLSRGVGDLRLAEVAAVVHAFAAGRHGHAMLLDALVLRGSSLVRELAYASGAAASQRGESDVIRELGNSVAELGSDASLLALAMLARGFRALQWGHEGLFRDLETASVRLFEEAAVKAQRPVRSPWAAKRAAAERPAVKQAPEGTVPVESVQLQSSHGHMLVSSLATLVESLSDDGSCVPGLLPVLQTWLPSLAPHAKSPELPALVRALAGVRHRDPRLLAALDQQAAELLATAIACQDQAGADLLEGVQSAGTQRGGGDGFVSEVSPAAALPWLAAFLDGAARQLAYPCSRTLAVLLGQGSGSGGTAGGSDRGLIPLQRLIDAAAARDADAEARGEWRILTPHVACVLVGALASAGHSTRSRRGKSAAAAVAALDQGDACHVFRAFLAASDAGVAEAFREELSSPLAGRLLAVANDAWQAAELGYALPRAQRMATAAAASPLQRLRGAGGVCAPRLLAESLGALGLPVFGACETPDGQFRVEQGVGLGGNMRSRRKAPSSVVGAPTWNPGESASSRSEWLTVAKEQPTEVLLDALLAPEAVTPQRLPVLLTLLESRTDLEAQLVAAGLARVAGVVVNSTTLQRLLPGGVLHDLLLRLLEEQAPDLTCADLLAGARLVAAWVPPVSVNAIAPAAAAVAAAAVARVLAGAEGGGATAVDGMAGKAEAAGATDLEVAALADALTRVQPWLAWLGTPEAEQALLGAEDWGDPDDVSGYALVGPGALAAAQDAVAELLLRVTSSGDAVTLHAVVMAAAAYGLEVPAEVARASDQGAAGRVVDEVLSPKHVHSMIASRLEPQQGSDQHVAFLRALLDCMVAQRQLQEQQQQGQSDRGGNRSSASELGAAATGQTGSVSSGSHLYAEVLLALGATASHLDWSALALSLQCATEAIEAGAGRHGGALDAVRQLLEAACTAAEAPDQGLKTGGSRVDRLFELTAAALRLQDIAAKDDPATAAAVSFLLSAVEAAPMEGVGVDAVARLLAAAATAAEAQRSAPGTAGQGATADVPSGDRANVATAPVVSVSLLDLLLRRLEESVNGTDAADPAEGPQSRRRLRKLPQLSYGQAVALLSATATATEETLQSAPSALASNSTPEIALQRRRRLADLRAGARIAFQALTPAVRHLDAPAAIRLLQLLVRANRVRIRPNNVQLLWALHERLRTLAPTLAPAAALDVLRGCVGLRWRPKVLIRELVVPVAAVLQLAADRVADGEGRGLPAIGAWTAAELHQALVLLGALQYSGPSAAPVVRLGIATLLRERSAGGARLSVGELSSLLWVCVATRYRGTNVLRPLMQQLLQVPPDDVPVAVASQAVWAAARLGIIGRRLQLWALDATKVSRKLSEAPPQSLSNLCWGLAKIGAKPSTTTVAIMLGLCVKRLQALRAHELTTSLFVLASWRAHFERPSHAAAVVQHVVATRGFFDGPAMCTMAWALQQLTASRRAAASSASAVTVGDGDGDASPEAPTLSGSLTGSAAVAAALDSAALAAFEERLLELMEAASQGTEPRIPDHQILRFLHACKASPVGGGGSHTPTRLIAEYSSSLRARLLRMGGGGLSNPAAAERRSRQLWAIAQSMHLAGLRDPELLACLEAAAELSQAVLLPGHLAGILNAMATLGHYPGWWARRGLLRRTGLALRSASVTESGLILEALATWRMELNAGTVAEAPPVSRRKASRERAAGDASAEAAEGQVRRAAADGQLKAGLEATEDEQAQEQGNGGAAAGEEQQGAAAKGRRPAPKVRGPSPQRLDLLRRVALARLTQLCAPSPQPPLVSPVSARPSPSLAAADAPAVGAAPNPAAPDPTPTAAPAASAAETSPTFPVAYSSMDGSMDGAASAAAPGEASAVGIDDAMRLLTSLAKLRWKCLPVEAALVRAASRLPVERRTRLPELTTLLWALASVRHDVPELLDDLQAALLGQPRQRPLAEEMAMLEAGGASAMAAAAAAAQAAAAAPAASQSAAAAQPATAAPLLPVQQRSPALEPALKRDGSRLLDIANGSVDSAAAEASPVAKVDGKDDGDDNARAASTASVDQVSDDAESASSAAAALRSTSGSGSSLLARPVKPATQAEAAPQAAAAAAPLDLAAAMAAAAASLNQRLDAHLDGPTGRGQLPTEPWKPADVFKALWACAKMNRHPGPQVLAAAERSWLMFTAAPQRDAVAGASGDGAGGPPPPPLHAVTGLLWALSVFRHHNGSFAQLLASQLAERLREPSEQAAVGKQALQLAACLLAAQADRSDSPLNTALTPEMRARLVAAWRGRLAARVARPLNRYQADLVSVLRKMGLTSAANVATPDGCAVVDVAVALMGPQGAAGTGGGGSGSAGAAPAAPRLIALELIGRHNSAANSPRLVGEAVLKYRLLQARGYMVVPVLCAEWDRISHQDVWTKMVYLQAKIDRRTGDSALGRPSSSQVAPPAAPTLVHAVSVAQGSADGADGR
ncbi:hypothetical protein GPECTOR_10g836 [Gonium pectorale]|uniref:Uncharacterized protein n=1 Tax=Gonium pectorale TaxID=33097 RepID=A0A150GQU6_GONPE|nr:hypothetical protein GPECTOR_10g836 [Gonium pectorale]|eukprot:KXZ52205.1 hypothetical protein GPECTOR_10g836 [Gonium pectorale]